MTADPLKLRDALAEDYLSTARRFGSSVSMEVAQQVAAGDLELTDAVEREPLPVAPRRAAVPEEERAPRDPDPAETAALELGGVLERRVVPAHERARPNPSAMVRGPNGLRVQPRKGMSQRQVALLRRMMVLCQNVPRGDGKIEAAFPKFREDILSEHWDYTIGRRRYRGKSMVDANRMFVRFMEDMADRSTGVLGPWWVR